MGRSKWWPSRSRRRLRGTRAASLRSRSDEDMRYFHRPWCAATGSCEDRIPARATDNSIANGPHKRHAPTQDSGGPLAPTTLCAEFVCSFSIPTFLFQFHIQWMCPCMSPGRSKRSGKPSFLLPAVLGFSTDPLLSLIPHPTGTGSLWTGLWTTFRRTARACKLRTITEPKGLYPGRVSPSPSQKHISVIFLHENRPGHVCG